MLGKPSRRTRKRLEEAGKPAMATVLEIAENGISVTTGPEGVVASTALALKTTLKVQPTDEPEFEVKTTFRYPQLSVPSAGQQLAVIYDPEDHDKIMLDDSPEAQSNAALAGTGLDAGSLGQIMQNAQQMQQQAMQQQAAGGPGFGFSAGEIAAQNDPVAKLEKLQALKEKGALTEEEFAAQKARILGES
jgi:hypothetical protein